MTVRKWLATAAASVVVIGGVMVAGAAPASADETWTQSFQRSGPTAPCEAPRALDIVWQDGWTGSPDWTPTWEQWPNAGEGGWTCTRSITWAHSAPPPPLFPAGNCVDVQSSTYYGQFNGGFSLDRSATVYADADCTVDANTTWVYYMVYAPAGFDAESLCLEAWGSADTLVNFGRDVWGCTSSV